MSSPSLDQLMEEWEAHLKELGSGIPPVVPFLDLAAHDMRSAAANIDCPYCRTHMMLEAEEIEHALERLRVEGNIAHSHGIGERGRGLATSFRIVVNVLLGGMRRAGVI